MSRLWSVALVLVIGLLPIAPPEHVHEVEREGHLDFVVHRHAKVHTGAGFHERHGGTHTVDHPDAPLVMLDQDVTMPSVARLAGPADIHRSDVIQPPPSTQLPVASFVERLNHGPPHASAQQRGPPSVPSS